VIGSPDPAARFTPRVVGAGETAVLVFTRTADFRHDSIPDANLAPYRAVLFLLKTGDVLGDAEQAAFERWIRAGGGWVGVHSASDTGYDWPFYGELASTYFAGHPEIQPATVRVEDRAHPATSALPEVWPRTDEW